MAISKVTNVLILVTNLLLLGAFSNESVTFGMDKRNQNMDELRQRIYDPKSGEIIRDEKFAPTKRKIKPHYHYHLTFYSAYAKATGDVSSLIIGQMDIENRIILDKDKLKIISNNYKISVGAIKMAASRMCQIGLMMRIAPALYFANPYYFTKTNVNRVDGLRKEYSEILFSTSNKAKRETPTEKEKKRITILNKQIKDILRDKS